MKPVVIDLSSHPVAQKKWAVRAYKKTAEYFLIANS
jgi:hypothetical protein